MCKPACFNAAAAARTARASASASAATGRRGVMVAGALVAQRAVDNHEIRRRPGGVDLPGRGQAEQQAASREQNNSSAIKTANGAPTTQPTMPTVRSRRRNVRDRRGSKARHRSAWRAGLWQAVENVAVGIEEANGRHIERRESFCCRASRSSASGENTGAASGDSVWQEGRGFALFVYPGSAACFAPIAWRHVDRNNNKEPGAWRCRDLRGN